MLQWTEKNAYFKYTVNITIAPTTHDRCFDKNSADIRCRPMSALWQSWMCCLTPLFFLFRVCVKKSSQERLALKILIDRPKARNEVRGNTLTLLSDVCCSEQHFQSVCCLLLIPVTNSSSLFLRLLSVLWFC